MARATRKKDLFLGLLLPALVFCLVVACAGGGAPEEAASPTLSLTPPPPTPPPPTPTPVPLDLLATRLVIPSLGIDSPVQPSQTIPYTYVPPPGCPARPQDTETLVVPIQGIATPADEQDGFANKVWIFGHSRWLGQPLLFFQLPGINVGDELFVDGTDRTSGQTLTHLQFVVTGLYLTDDDSGESLLEDESPADVAKPQVILQTSVREDGIGKQWILDRNTILTKTTNLVQGDLDDPCKYLLLFVVADEA